jgi:hypothetical protein
MTLTLLLQLTDEEQLYASNTPQPVVIEAQQPQPEEAPAVEIVIVAADDDKA